jgi:hypothetical protein
MERVRDKAFKLQGGTPSVPVVNRKDGCGRRCSFRPVQSVLPAQDREDRFRPRRQRASL